MSSERQFYVVSLKHTRRDHQYITVWRPDDKGYAFPLSWAGQYRESRIKANLGYYHSGCSAVAVPCEVLDQVAIAPARGMIDNDAGPVVMNNRGNWLTILGALPWEPPYKPHPEYKGARRRKDK